jgi:hypothetical protein
VRILGFPFPSAVFERSGDYWLDFVGPLTLPALLANFVICLMLPPALLKAYVRLRPSGVRPPDTIHAIDPVDQPELFM